MPLLVALIVLVISLSTLGGFLSNELNLPGQANIAQILEVYQKETLTKSQETITVPVKKESLPYYPIIQTPKTEPKPEKEITPPALLDTYIHYGPANNEVISDTNELVFEFRGKILSEEIEGQIRFQTKVEGLETEWQDTYSQERSIEFPSGPKEYTFLVRAKVNDIVDPTPATRTFKLNISPYFDKVKISSLKKPAVQESSLITLSTQINKGEEINITGWEFEAEYGRVTLPQGIEQFNPLSESQELKDIILKPGDWVYISTEANPLGPKGWNFRPNKCMGYLTSSRDFPIPISQNCPKIQESKLPRYLEKCCKEYISTLGTCQAPKYQGMKDYGIFEDDNCLSYLESTFTYAGCFANFYQDSNFQENKWHIYLDREHREIMDKTRDTIYIRDQNGLLVTEYSYGEESCCK